MKKVVVSLLAGIAIGVLLTPLVLANGSDQTQSNTEWCFYYEYDSLKHYNHTDPPAEKVLLRFNGNKVRVSVPCSAQVYP